ncbi:MAG: UvrB/UvrC motif-containing protein [Candidatus Omnitrophica bacterium]|nr:UvrB/UvrC motif-containing protein [Candidatus Omnitrophota bacterium]
MLCDICKKNPATVHLTEIIDNQMNELHLCEECARNKSAAMEQQFGLSDLLAGMADFEKPVKDEEAVSVKCPNCNLTYADFKKVGRLGCGECYNVFRKYLAPLLKRIHGASRHVGKAPLKGKAPARPGRKKPGLEELKDAMQRAVREENFEEAARLRDKIRAIEEKKES